MSSTSSTSSTRLLFYPGMYMLAYLCFSVPCDFGAALIVSVAVLSSDLSAPADYHQSPFSPDSHCAACVRRDQTITLFSFLCARRRWLLPHDLTTVHPKYCNSASMSYGNYHNYLFLLRKRCRHQHPRHNYNSQTWIQLKPLINLTVFLYLCAGH